MYSIEEIDTATFPSSLKLKFPNRVILVNARLFHSETGITECFQKKKKKKLTSQSPITCSKLIETLVQGVKYVQR